MESRGVVSQRPGVQSVQHSKFLSPNDDSGYSSEVFTSPEFSRGSWNIGIPKNSSNKSCLLFDGPATRSRLASTPLNSSLANKDLVFPSPEVVEIKKYGLRSDSAIDSTASDIDESELEIVSRKVSESTLNIIKGQRKPSIRNAITKSENSKIAVLKPVLQKSVRIKSPQNILSRILKEAEYLIYEVLKHLSALDLISVSHVNRQLRSIIHGSKELNNKRLLHITKTRNECTRVGKENFKLKRLNESAGTSTSSSFSTSHGRLSPRKQFGEIQNVLGPNERKSSIAIACPPVALSDRFIEEGKKLHQGEELQKCVKCKAPAKVYKNAAQAVCSNVRCGYDYCTKCFLPSHRKAQECSTMKPRTRKGSGMLSKKCKKNLRRL